jgi:mono/diheme cytochrome c family protein
MIRRPWPWLLGVGALTGACTGIIGGEPSDGPNSTPTAFACDEGQVPEALPLRRLSHLQYRNTLADLVRFASPSAAAEILGEADPNFEKLPSDQRVGPDKHYAGFTRLDQALQQQHVDGAYDVAEKIGRALAASPSRLAELAGACATDSDPANDDACLDDMIRKFGERALRKPVTDEDVAFYRGPAGAAPFEAADYADVVALLLNAPHMLYFVEHGQQGNNPTAPLDAYEIASRLSYHFWQTLPDEQLFTAARSGDLLTEAGYAAEVERVFNDARTRAAMGELFGQWLDNTTLEELDARVGTPLFDAFTAGYTPGPDLREHMLAEVTDAALYYTFEDPGTFRDLLTSRKSFARTEDLASLYHVPVWSGGEPPEFTEPERVGLLTRAAYLATGSANTRPIMKGVFLRKALLCDDIPPPPPNAAANPPQLSDTLSTREVVEELTGNGACAGCHGVSINALGFATENFDSLGRVRAEQTLFDPETGAVVGTAQVDTAAVPRVEITDEQVAANAGELTKLIAESPKPYACFARQYFRFTFGRLEDLDRDACALADVKLALDEGKPMADVLRSIARSQAFRMRSFED